MRSTVMWGLIVWGVAWATSAYAYDGLQSQTQGDGLRGRLMLGTGTTGRSDAPAASFAIDGPKVQSLSLMGDYYLTRPWVGTAGGLRATSGVLLGQRSLLWGSPFGMDRRSAPWLSGDDTGSTTPYLGVGYTDTSAKGGWGLSADLGLMALNPRSAVRLGKVFNGSQNLDDAVRELRLSPVLQLGVSYAF